MGLGYLFSDELEVAIHWAQHFGTALGIVIGVPIGLYAASRGLTLLQMIRQLRLRRISAPMLARKLRSKSKVAVLDLSSFEEETDTQIVEAIPGAFGVDPTLLRKSPHIHIPDDVKVILYSSSGSDTVSARAAVGLKRIGVDNVWVLEGGLQAWREYGLPVAQCLEAPEIVAERFGVRLPAQSPAAWTAQCIAHLSIRSGICTCRRSSTSVDDQAVPSQWVAAQACPALVAAVNRPHQ